MAPVQVEPIDDEDPTNIQNNPVVKAITPLDEQYLALDRECQIKVTAIQAEYTAKQQDLLHRRQQILEAPTLDKNPCEGGAESEEIGTPALPDFWLHCFQHHPDIREIIYDVDIPVLRSLRNVTEEALPDDSGLDQAGFRLIFTFTPNKYFKNETIVKEYHTKELSPYNQEIEVVETIILEPIEWKDGQDITVETKKKKKKGKKSGPGSTTKKPRESFFRIFFRNLKKGDEPPEDLVAFQRARDEEESESEEEDDADDLMEMLMDDDHHKGCAMRSAIIPYAVRWFTGEATPEEDEYSDTEDEDGDDDEEESDSEAPPKDKKMIKNNLFAADGGQTQATETECKQQ